MSSSPLQAVNLHFPTSEFSISEIALVQNISPFTSHITMTIPSPIVTQTSSLVSTVIDTYGSIDPRAEFDEDIVVSIGEYYYSKPDKTVIRKGKKRTRDQSGMDVYVSEKIVWTQQSNHPHVDAADIACHIPIPHYYAELKISSRSLTAHRNTGHSCDHVTTFPTLSCSLSSSIDRFDDL